MNIHIYRKVPDPLNRPATVLIELGKYWMISITREFAESYYNQWRHGGPMAHKIQDLFKGKSFIKLIKEGEIIPHWYGYAYRNFDTDTAIFMPVPLNLVRAAWEWFKVRVVWKIKYGWPRAMDCKHKDQQEIIRKMLSGESVPIKHFKVDTTEWRGMYGSSE